MLVDLEVPAALPGTHTATPAAVDAIDHLMAARAPAAWNVARVAIPANQPILLVTDFFGAGAPNAAVNAALTPGDFAVTTLHNHGYHVLATILGTFDSVASLGAGPNRVVGLFPRRADARVLDLQSTAATVADRASAQNEALRLVRTLPRRVVINSSTGFQTPVSLPTARVAGAAWLTKVRTAGPGNTSLEGRFLHVKAAGNDGGVLAVLASEVAAAALLPNMVDASGAPAANLTNTLIVENVLNTTAEPFEPGCRAFSSNVGGNVAAVGTAVFSLTDAGTTAGDLNGTSMATPQVAAVATYLWSLAPLLTPQEVLARIRATARPGVPQTNASCSPIASATAPAIDAYAAVLSADDGLTAPLVRRTLLDVADASGAAAFDVRFDEHDIERFLDEFDARAGTSFDYTRYDLNGDGRTGGPTLARFDLDANVLPAWSSLTRTIEGLPVTFDETQLTDLQILCFYAYSGLYQGDPGARATHLGSRCGSPGSGALLEHHVSLDVETTINGAQTIETFQRPITGDLASPFEPAVVRSPSDATGSASLDTAITADDVAAAADGAGFTGADLGWRASCRAATDPGTPQASARATSTYTAVLRFAVGDAGGAFTVSGALPAVFDSSNLFASAMTLIRDGQTIAEETNTAATPLSFTHTAIGAGTYQLTVSGQTRCTAGGGLPLQEHAVTLGVSVRF